MSWQPSLSWENAKARAEIIQKIRQFFADKNIIEVETPILSSGTTTDVHLETFSTRYKFLDDSNQQFCSPMYLQTSPEFSMKRLLASGYGCIYQISKAFRHEQYGRHHNPEFTMLEWYRVGFDHFDLMDEVSDLLTEVLNCKPCVRMTYQEVFIKYLDIDPLDVSINQLITLIKSEQKFSRWLEDETDIDTLLQFIFSEIVEPHIGLDAPYFIYHFPSSQASLAKISTIDSRIADRFECYYHGMELANGFNELTDARQQESRFNKDNDNRAARGFPRMPIDNNLIAALNIGLPDSAGVALGIDRLVMLALNEKHINQVLSFPITSA
tara:strand:+ start:299 stop:1276 length:978 start_codon:yes stop_codon:yes gene_type:complete